MSSVSHSNGSHFLKMEEEFELSVLLMAIKDLLFPKLKFINKKTDLEFDTDERKLCGFMLKHCHVSIVPDGKLSSSENAKALLDRQKEWWSVNKIRTSTRLCDHRNNKIKGIHNAFKGTAFILW